MPAEKKRILFIKPDRIKAYTFIDFRGKMFSYLTSGKFQLFQSRQISVLQRHNLVSFLAKEKLEGQDKLEV